MQSTQTRSFCNSGKAVSGAVERILLRPSGLSPSEHGSRPDYCNEAVFRRNCLPPRSYHIPETAILLNGTWDFHLASTAAGAPDAAQSKDIEWKSVTVPGHWQPQGYGKPGLTNTQSPIPACPPDVSTENPTGVYRRMFQPASDWPQDSQLRLRFEGVNSAYHVYVNGALVGYAQGSGNPSEFDISEYVNRDSTNELFVKVYQWCDGTDIEHQDQWRLSGIFKDVYLISFLRHFRIEDWSIQTDLDAQSRNAVLFSEVTVLKKSRANIKMSLFELQANGGALIGSSETDTGPGNATIKLTLPVLNPKKWTAETPYMYLVKFTLSSQSAATYTTQQRIGFRKAEDTNNSLL